MLLQNLKDNGFLHQEAFFGCNLMDTSNLEEDKKQIGELESKTVPEETTKARKVGASIRLSQVRCQKIAKLIFMHKT